MSMSLIFGTTLCNGKSATIKRLSIIDTLSLVVIKSPSQILNDVTNKQINKEIIT